jgi:hypothetical protein
LTDEIFMNADFDPYYLWLGIPPHEQPPNHYRLLGIAAFEPNASVIDSAASRQSTYLHSVAAGPQRQASQKLLTEIAVARRTLLNAESKQIYDAELKARLEPAAPKPAAIPIARPIAVAVPVAAPITAPVIAPVAAPIAAPIAVPVVASVVSPVAAPVATPVAAPVVAPVATPIAAPVAAPVVVPTHTPSAETAAPVEPEAAAELDSMANLFGSFEPELSRAAGPPPVPTLTSSPTPSPPPIASLTAARSSKKLIWIACGGIGALALILGIVFRPKGDRDEVPAPKKSTSKKPKAKTPDDDTPASPESSAVTAANIPKIIRFVRIELPRKGVLSVAEVETFYDNRNVASYGALAEQSSTEGAAAAGRAVDGKTSGKAGDNSLSQTKDTDMPWWKVDLGGGYPLEKIVIHNATDPGASERMAGFTLLLMDRSGRTIVELKDQPAPNPRSEFVVKDLPLAIATPASGKPKPRKKQ